MSYDLALFIFGWIVCGVIGAGFAFAYVQGQYPDLAAENRAHDIGFALLCGLIFGPGWLVIAFFLSGFGKYGWWTWRRKREP